MKAKTKRVLKDVPASFVGWDKIIRLAENAITRTYYPRPSRLFDSFTRFRLQEKLRKRDRALIVTAFLTGGRISEVLMARRQNFEIKDDFIVVTGLPLLKGYVKQVEVVGTAREIPPKEGVKRGFKWVWDGEELVFMLQKFYTIPQLRERGPFPIPRWEPLTDVLIEYLEGLEDDWLFRTTFKPTRIETPGVQRWIDEVFKGRGRFWISPQRAFQIVSETAEKSNITVPKIGVSTLGIWNHWFRAQRAHQLVRDYGFDDRYLNAFFGWAEPRGSSTARQYVRLGEYDLELKMIENRERHETLFKRDVGKPVSVV